MVRPARRTEEHPRIGIDRRDQLEAEAKRAAAAGRLNAGDPLVIRMLAKQDRADQLGESLVAGASEITFGLLRIDQTALGLLDRP